MAAPTGAGIRVRGGVRVSAHGWPVRWTKPRFGTMRLTADDVPDGVGANGEGCVAAGSPGGGQAAAVLYPEVPPEAELI